MPPSPGVRTYAEPSFAPRRPLVEGIAELTERIFNDFVYDPGFTTVTTPLEEVLQFRRGVCQDFAHLAIGCLRSMGLAARYVSGYLETAPPPGRGATHRSRRLPRLAVGVRARTGDGWTSTPPTTRSSARPT